MRNHTSNVPNSVSRKGINILASKIFSTLMMKYLTFVMCMTVMIQGKSHWRSVKLLPKVSHFGNVIFSIDTALDTVILYTTRYNLQVRQMYLNHENYLLSETVVWLYDANPVLHTKARSNFFHNSETKQTNKKNHSLATLFKTDRNFTQSILFYCSHKLNLK